MNETLAQRQARIAQRLAVLNRELAVLDREIENLNELLYTPRRGFLARLLGR